MKTLTSMVVLTGLCCLDQPVYAQGASFCEQFVVTGSSLVFKLCIRSLDKEAEVLRQDRLAEWAALSMSNVDLTKFVKDLQNSIRDIEKKTGKVAPSDIKLLYEGADDLRGRCKDLEKRVDAQESLLDAHHQEIVNLRSQIDTMRAPTRKEVAP